MVKIMTTGLERLVLVIISVHTNGSVCVCVCLHHVPCTHMVLCMGQCWCFLPRCSYSAHRMGSPCNQWHTCSFVTTGNITVSQNHKQKFIGSTPPTAAAFIMVTWFLSDTLIPHAAVHACSRKTERNNVCELTEKVR